MKNQSRHSLLRGAILAIAALTLSACGGGASSSEETLNINSFGGTFQEAIESSVVQPFEEKTGKSVDITTLISGEALTLLKADGAALDVAYMDLAVVEQAKKAGVLQPLNLDKIPSSKELYPIAVDEEGYWVAELTAMTGIAYNTEKVTTPPTSWADLWKPEYAGKVAISNVAASAGYQFLVEAAKMNGGDEQNIDPGFEAIKKLKPNLSAIYTSPDEMSKLLTSGEAWIGPWYSDRASALKASGAPIGFVKPKEGAVAILSVMVIPKDAKNVELAHEYIDFQVSADINGKFVQTIAEGSTNRNVKMEQAYLDDNFIAFGEEAFNSLVTVDNKVIAEELPEWITRWTAEIAY